MSDSSINGRFAHLKFGGLNSVDINNNEKNKPSMMSLKPPGNFKEWVA